MGEFEKDMQRLEEIAKKLTDGEIGIEASMELYAEGVRLADALTQKLDTYKSKIEILETEVKDGE